MEGVLGTTTNLFNISELSHERFCRRSATRRVAILNEPVARFKSRMELVAAHMNSPAFSAAGGRGLCGLARDLRWRCEEVVKRKGERLPK